MRRTPRGSGRRREAARRALAVGVLCVALAGAAPATDAETITPARPGDVTGDGERKVDDLSALAGVLFGLQPGGAAAADMNGDGRPAAADLTALLPAVVAEATTSIAVLFLGDGMGVEHVRAGLVLAGGRLDFADFPVTAMIDTASLTTLATGEPTDSAAGATALATGERVFNGEVSRRGDRDLPTLGELALGAGKSVGLVTNSHLFDASPAAFVAHANRRDNLRAIADQYLAVAPTVLIGAVPRGFRGLETFVARARARGYTVVRSAAELAAVDLMQVRRLLGLFAVDADVGLPPVERAFFPVYGTPRLLRGPDAPDPPLAEAAAAAIRVLARNPYGFFLFVENENIDTLSHAGRAAHLTTLPLGALVGGEVVELDASVTAARAALTLAGRADDALLVVTADHECGGFTFPGTDPAAGTFPAAPNHTGVPVPVYATGQGAARLAHVTLNTHVFHALRPAVR